jgi:uncharacterized membrane protein
MMLAIGLGLLGVVAMRRAHRRCRAYAHGWAPPGWYGDAWGPPPWGPRRGRRGRWALHAALSHLDATPAQERAIVAELSRLARRADASRDAALEARGDAAAAIRGPELDEAALGAALGRIDGATAELRAAAIEALRAVHAALDDEQRGRLAELLERGSPRHPRGWGPYR